MFTTFGCLRFPLLHPNNSHKLIYSSKHCIFIGYGYHHKGYRCLDPISNKILVTRHVVFVESQFPGLHPSPSTTPSPSVEATCAPILLKHLQHMLQAQVIILPMNFYILIPPPCPQIFPQIPSLQFGLPPPKSTLSSPYDNSIINGFTLPQNLPDYHTFYFTKHPLHALSNVMQPIEPTCYSQASTSSEWHAAMGQEFDALISNGTWYLCPKPLNHNIIRNKWVYKFKRKPNGSIEHFKACLAAKGYDKKFGIDFIETFSSIVKSSTIRLILAIVVQLDWDIQQLNVSNAFLHGHLNEVIYIEQPRGFIDPQYPHHVCRLHKTLYGLK